MDSDTNTEDNERLALRLLVMLGAQTVEAGDAPMRAEMLAFATKWLKEN